MSKESWEELKNLMESEQKILDELKKVFKQEHTKLMLKARKLLRDVERFRLTKEEAEAQWKLEYGRVRQLAIDILAIHRPLQAARFQILTGIPQQLPDEND